MNKPIIAIYKFDILFEILSEIEEALNYKIKKVSNLKDLKQLTYSNKNSYVVITKFEDAKIENYNHYVIKALPIKIIELKEKINIAILKGRFKAQSNIVIKNYNLNLNSRELIKNDIKLKLTQKEIEIIMLLEDLKKNQTVSDLQKKVWEYNSNLETHTVETHIYRLRKKIFEKFSDNSFILSEENGYKI